MIASNRLSAEQRLMTLQIVNHAFAGGEPAKKLAAQLAKDAGLKSSRTGSLFQRIAAAAKPK